MTPLTRAQQALVESVLDEIIRFAGSLATRLGLEPEEMIGEARLELVKIVRHVDVSRDTPFAAYAFPGVRGTILDAAGKRKKSALYAYLARQLRRETPRAIDDDDDDSDKLDISLATIDVRATAVGKLRAQALRMAGSLALTAPPPTTGDNEMVDRIFQARVTEALHANVAELVTKERKVIEMRYFEHATLAQTAEALDTSTRNVQRLEDKALEKLGVRLRAAGMSRAS